MEHKVFTTKLVGLSFRPEEIKDIVKALEWGDRLQLIREPGNAYDMNAIKILNEDEDFLGYIAASKAIHTCSEIAPFLDNGYDYTCEVIEGGTPYAPALRIEVFKSEEESEADDTASTSELA